MLLIDALRAGGWPESELGNALGIVSHESSGNPTAHNPGTAAVPEDSWGLFQINRQAHSYSIEQLCDPVFNATVAYQLFKAAGNYRDWYYSAQAESLPPFGNAHHSISEFQALANVDVGGGAGTQPPGPTIGGQPILPIILGVLGVLILLDLLTS